MAGKRVLVTGFGPFPGQPDNPSATLVKALKREFAKAGKTGIRCVILKTEYKKSLRRLEKEIADFNPDVVVCFGVAAGEKGFRLETVARNRSSIKLADAAGNYPERPAIIEGARKTYAATLPFSSIKKKLDKAGIRARLSKDAGKYLCNYIFYHASARRDVKCGFAHIPVPSEKTLTQADLLRGANIILKSVS